MTHIQIAPEDEFKLDIDLPGITESSRDYDVQQHKIEVYALFEDRLKKPSRKGLKLILLSLVRI